MKKLTHTTYNAYLRQMQMSQAEFFIFLEGHTDRDFYARIFKSLEKEIGDSYKIVTIKEIGCKDGGKGILLDFFSYLRSNASLCKDFKGKTTVAFFYIDKDVDDFMRTKRRSEHVIYTETYNSENYLFKYGNIVDSAAASSGLDRSFLENGLKDWKDNAADRWKDWVSLCFFSRVNKLNSTCNYGHKKSPINERITGGTNEEKFKELKESIRTKAKMGKTDFEKKFQKKCSTVNRLYKKGDYDRIFNGKWYKRIVEEEIKNIAGSTPVKKNGLGERMISTLSLTLDYDAAWADHFKDPLRKFYSELHGNSGN